MAGDESRAKASNVISVVLHPSVVPLVDLFRGLRDLEARNQLMLAEQAEAALRRWSTPELARSLVSEALIVILALARQSKAPFAHQPRGSRRTSLDENAFLSVLASVREPTDIGACEQAAATLGVAVRELPMSAMKKLAALISEADLVWPSLGDEVLAASQGLDPVVASLDDAAFKFKN